MKPEFFLHETIVQVNRFLEVFYADSDNLEPTLYLLEPSEELGRGGQVLLKETSDSIEIGIRFGTHLYATFSNPADVGSHEIGVVAEEISHFRMMVHAWQSMSQISIVDLEVLGEIDRFLTLMHWQHSFPAARETHFQQAQSLEMLCTHLFQSRTFKCSEEECSLYVLAEAVAMKHLSRAFEHHWNDSFLNHSEATKKAKRYLLSLRESVVYGGASARVLLEENTLAC